MLYFGTLYWQACIFYNGYEAKQGYSKEKSMVVKEATEIWKKASFILSIVTKKTKKSSYKCKMDCVIGTLKDKYLWHIRI